MTLSLKRRIAALGAAIVATTAGAVVVAPPAAQAGPCNTIQTCGSVNNNGRFVMHVTESWDPNGTDRKATPHRCARWRGGPTPTEIVWCKQMYLAPFGRYGGRMGTKLVDVDAFTFNSNNFYWAGTLVTKGQWIKIGPGEVKCTADVGDLPRCG